MLPASQGRLSHTTLIFSQPEGPEVCGLGKEAQRLLEGIPLPQLLASADAGPAVPAGDEALPSPWDSDLRSFCPQGPPKVRTWLLSPLPPHVSLPSELSVGKPGSLPAHEFMAVKCI